MSRVVTKTGWMLGVATQARLDALARSATTQTPVLVTTLRERGRAIALRLRARWGVLSQHGQAAVLSGAARCCLVLVCINTRRPRRLALRHAQPARGHAGL